MVWVLLSLFSGVVSYTCSSQNYSSCLKFKGHSETRFWCQLKWIFVVAALSAVVLQGWWWGVCHVLPCQTQVLFTLLMSEMLLLQHSQSCRSSFRNASLLCQLLPVGLDGGQSAESFTPGGVCSWKCTLWCLWNIRRASGGTNTMG